MTALFGSEQLYYCKSILMISWIQFFGNLPVVGPAAASRQSIIPAVALDLWPWPQYAREI